MSKLGINVEECQFDRAHRVGYHKDIHGNIRKERQMIVKFATFRARTLVYKNRKKGNNNVRFYIDQTKRRFNLRKMAAQYVENKPDVDFAFVDINCSLCIRFKNGEYKFFNSETELKGLVG